jgi:ElaB/YqjD/DUF883 family membrane-anchored ribosome-binding protein
MATGNNPSLGAQKAEKMVSQTANEAKDKAQHLMDKARDTASNIGDKARDTATALKDKADTTIATVGQKMTALGDTLHAKAPQEGVLGSAASSVADNLRAGGRYLQDHRLDDMGRDLTNLIRQNPIPALLVGFGVGCLLGMSMRRR